MFILEAILPEWVGDENGIIENLQMLSVCFTALKLTATNMLTGAVVPRLFGKQAQFTFSCSSCAK